MLRFFALALILLFPLSAHAKLETVKIRGTVDFGTDTGSIGGIHVYPFCIFNMESVLSDKIFATCHYNEECEVIGSIDKHNNLIRLHQIRHINLNNEPSVDILIDAASWALGAKNKIATGNITISTLYILDLHTIKHNNQTSFILDFKLDGHENRTLKELGKGKVRLIRRGETWQYFR